MQVARNGLRTTPEHGDGAGTRQSYQRLPDGNRWLRITRKDNVWTAWTSPDGKNWTFGVRHFKPLPSTVGAGIVFRALPQDAQMYFRGSRIKRLVDARSTRQPGCQSHSSDRDECGAIDWRGCRPVKSGHRGLANHRPRTVAFTRRWKNLGIRQREIAGCGECRSPVSQFIQRTPISCFELQENPTQKVHSVGVCSARSMLERIGNNCHWTVTLTRSDRPQFAAKSSLSCP